MSRNQSAHDDLSSDEYEEYENNSDLITLELRRSTIRLKYWQLCKHSPHIPNIYPKKELQECLSSDIRQFEEENNINEINIINFFKIYQDENVAITNDNFRDYYKISEFLRVKSFLTQLKKYEKKYSNDIDFIISKILDEMSNPRNGLMPKDDFLFQMEEHLTHRIEDCIKSENFIQIPISMIYRIIEKSDKEKVSSDWLLDFILGSIDKLCVLFPLVDFFNLSKEKFLKFKNFFESDDSKNVISNTYHLISNILNWWENSMILMML